MVKKLLQEGYAGLFLYGDPHSGAAALWQGGAGKDALEEVIQDTAAEPYARFLAMEVLRSQVTSYAPPANRRTAVAEAYATALSLTGHTPTEAPNGNAWGYLWWDGDPGIGQVLIDMGDASLSPLQGLLSDTTPVYYEGSKEAMIGNGLHYRLKDFAVYYIAQIKGYTLPNFKDLGPTERDAAIAQMRTTLGL